MTAPTAEISAGVLCHRCGYDLRAPPPDGKCPECGESVAESHRLAAIPRRPAWRDSDPRWRRRMLAGAWILVLLPLIDTLSALGWAAKIPVPAVLDFRGTLRTLEDTLLCWPGVHGPILFCMGMVLLFAKERRQHHGRLDWTRRWGVICSYVVSLLSAANVLIIAALVLAGISFLFMSISLKYQPRFIPLFVNVSTTYLRYGPYPGRFSYPVLVGFSSTLILLACAPLFDALRSTGPQRLRRILAAILLAPLALFALMHLAQAAGYCLGFSRVTLNSIYSWGVYFQPQAMVIYIAGSGTYLWGQMPGLGTFAMEATKWFILLTIAVWLSLAQLAARRQSRKRSSHRAGEHAGGEGAS